MPDYQLGKIYQIVNTQNDCVYIGSTAQSYLSTRFGGHLRNVNKSTLLNHPLYKDMKAIGCDQFKILLIKAYPCNSKYELEAAEYEVIKEWIKQNKNLYNLRTEKCGYKLSEEVKNKMSLSQTGRTHSEETKQKMSAAQTGKILSDETKQKLSMANVGKKMSEETKQKISVGNMNKIISNETREKISLATTGKLVSSETKAKLSNAAIGNSNKFNYGCISHSNKKNYWSFSFQIEGKQRSKCFSCSKYGYLGSKLMAEKARKAQYPNFKSDGEIDEQIAIQQLSSIEI